MGYRRDGAKEAGTPRMRQIQRILWAILGLNVMVALSKLVWGYLSGSFAMEADGFHSLFDSASNVVGLLGIYLASRPADKNHPYGHSKYETYASAAIGAMLALAAWRIGSTAVAQFISGSQSPRVDAISFGVMLTTLAINIGVTTYERHMGKRLHSEILLADASHTRSDVFVSLGVIGGLLAVKMGYPEADPVIALLVSLAIARTAFGVIRQATETLSDVARIDADKVCVVVRGVDGVLGCHHVRTRGGPSEVYLDLHVQVDPAMSVDAGHEIAEAVERTICHEFPEVADVIVHLEPLDDYQVSKTAKEIDAGLA